MTIYDVEWTSIDGGAEQQWHEPIWGEVLRIVAKHEGVEYGDADSPFFDELENRLPGVKWRSIEDGKPRSLFRDYRYPWTRTDTLDLSDKRLRLTRLGRRFVEEEIDRTGVFLILFRHFREDNDYPFRIIAAAFMELPVGEELGLRELYWAVEKGYRPGKDDIESSISAVDQGPPTGNPRRRLRLMARLMADTGAIEQTGDRWKAADYQMLSEIAGWDILVPIVHRAFADANLHYDAQLVQRYISALLAKRFVILTGLSGSGKTKIAQGFARWLGCSAEDGSLAVIPVGADWSTRDAVLGYPDALDRHSYISTPALDTILEALKHPDKPYFLILDEMNLSHVERYFADLLSAMESGEPVHLHNGPEPRNGVPPKIESIPDNLFIVGTVNVDETTYMFSPKVLDRANVIEFRIDRNEMQSFLSEPSSIDMEKIAGKGSNFSYPFVGFARQQIELGDGHQNEFVSEMLRFFEALERHGAEFGFRTAMESARFLGVFTQLAPEDDDRFEEAMDAVIAQKLLPKLNGSRAQLEPVLCILGKLCYSADHVIPEGSNLINTCDLLDRDAEGEELYPLVNARFKLSFEKIRRMLRNLENAGFTSFAEA